MRMRSVANSRLPAVVLGTYHNVQRISRHGRLSILLRVHQRPAWVATCTRDGPQKPDGRPQLLHSTRPHVADHDRPAKPRIMLIGWLGARKHHLDKCAMLVSVATAHILSTRCWTGTAQNSVQVCAAVAEQGLRHFDGAATDGGHRAALHRRCSCEEVLRRTGKGA